MVPTTTVPLDNESDAKKVLRLVDLLEEHDDVQNVYANFDIPDAILELRRGLSVAPAATATASGPRGHPTGGLGRPSGPVTRHPTFAWRAPAAAGTACTTTGRAGGAGLLPG